MSQYTGRNVAEAGMVTLPDRLSLSAEKQRVLAWMQKQTQCSLKALIDFLDQTEETTDGLLRELLQQGFVQAIATEPETLYQVRLGSARQRRSYPLTESILDSLISGE
ncbi:MAG: hypothetical protein AAFQ89_04850 [Cyanobacteria bacterium J06626_18]